MKRVLFLLFCTFSLFAQEECRLMKDLMIVNFWDCYLAQRFPVTYNHLLYGGYLNMPSGRMGTPGEIGLGYAHVPPYCLYNFRAQLVERLEFSGNYRIFKGIKDPTLSEHGFGDLSDRTANVKLAFFTPEDSNYRLPGVAIGFEDFLGTKNFTAEYIVMTKVHRDLGLEWSLGVGADRIKGFFGGAIWMPFQYSRFTFLNPLALVAEYDATDYKEEKHPKGRSYKTRINVGAKYRLFDRFDFSISYMRGKKVAATVSAYYNFGCTKGFLPKIHDRSPYRAPINNERIGPLRSESVMVQDFRAAMQEQGLDLMEVDLALDEYGQRILRLYVSNNKYRTEREVKCRLLHILTFLTPVDIDKVTVVRIAYGYPIQEYHFPMTYISSLRVNNMGCPELDILTPMCNYLPFVPCSTRRLFKKPGELYNIELLPKTRTLFGSSRGKIKYSAGLTLGVNGFLPYNIYYSTRFGYIFFTDMDDVSSVDKLNPSQLLNVRTDAIDYYKQKGLTVDELYAQKVWSMGKGWFARIAGGYFEQMYGGFASEVLWFPTQLDFACGAEVAIVKKRNFKGLGFRSTIRKLDGFEKEYVKFTGTQGFLNLYYDWRDACLEFKVQGGKFLANDWGGRFEVSRYFCSGLRVTLWVTYTNGNDRINGHQYYDKGIGLSMPLDIFYTHSERDRWRYYVSAWLRDVGQTAYTGQKLYEQISDERQW